MRGSASFFQQVAKDNPNPVAVTSQSPVVPNEGAVDDLEVVLDEAPDPDGRPHPPSDKPNYTFTPRVYGATPPMTPWEAGEAGLPRFKPMLGRPVRIPIPDASIDPSWWQTARGRAFRPP